MRFTVFFGKRRTAAFGWRYDFNGAGLQKSAPMPAFLTQFREIAGAFAEIPPDAFEQALITEYAAGAGIGWHRDRPQFGVIVALSFAAPCRLRFRRQKQGGWDRADIIAPPRSVYLLSGEARLVGSIPFGRSKRFAIRSHSERCVRALRELDEVFAMLARSPFRRRFKLGVREQAYLRDKGLPEILRHAREFVARGWRPPILRTTASQTPMRNHPVFIAQHATATCCRGCFRNGTG